MKLSNKDKTSNKKQPAKKGSLNFSFGKKEKEVEAVDPETFVYTPRLPKVNAVPFTITQKYEVKGVLRKVGFGLIGLVVVLALGFGGTQAYIASLNNQLTTLEEDASTLKAQADSLSVYSQYKNAIEGKRQALASSVQTDVNMGVIYSDLYSTAGNINMTLGEVSIQQAEDPNGIEAGACMNPDPFVENASIVGCITIESSSTDPNAGKRYVESLVSLSEVQKYVNPFISSVTTDDEGLVRFSMNIAFTNALYTNQYASLQKSLAEILAPPAEGTEEGEETTTPPVAEEDPVTPAASVKLDDVLETELPDASPEVASQINQIATASCLADEPSAEIAKIQAILEPTLGLDNNISAVMDALNTQIALQCEGIKNNG